MDLLQKLAKRCILLNIQPEKIRMKKVKKKSKPNFWNTKNGSNKFDDFESIEAEFKDLDFVINKPPSQKHSNSKKLFALIKKEVTNAIKQTILMFFIFAKCVNNGFQAKFKCAGEFIEIKHILDRLIEIESGIQPLIFIFINDPKAEPPYSPSNTPYFSQLQLQNVFISFNKYPGSWFRDNLIKLEKYYKLDETLEETAALNIIGNQIVANRTASEVLCTESTSSSNHELKTAIVTYKSAFNGFKKKEHSDNSIEEKATFNIQTAKTSKSCNTFAVNGKFILLYCDYSENQADLWAMEAPESKKITEIIVNKLDKTFQKINFKVVKPTNDTLKNVKQIKEFVENELKDEDFGSLIVCFVTKLDRDGIICTRDKFETFSEFKDIVAKSNYFKDKPKIFIIYNPFQNEENDCKQLLSYNVEAIKYQFEETNFLPVNFTFVHINTNQNINTASFEERYANEKWFAKEFSKLFRQNNWQFDFVTNLKILFAKSAFTFLRKYCLPEELGFKNQNMFYVTTFKEPFFLKDRRETSIKAHGIAVEGSYEVDSPKQVDETAGKYEMEGLKVCCIIKFGKKHSTKKILLENKHLSKLQATFKDKFEFETRLLFEENFEYAKSKVNKELQEYDLNKTKIACYFLFLFTNSLCNPKEDQTRENFISFLEGFNSLVKKPKIIYVQDLREESFFLPNYIEEDDPPFKKKRISKMADFYFFFNNNANVTRTIDVLCENLTQPTDFVSIVSMTFKKLTQKYENPSLIKKQVLFNLKDDRFAENSKIDDDANGKDDEEYQEKFQQMVYRQCVHLDKLEPLLKLNPKLEKGKLIETERIQKILETMQTSEINQTAKEMKNFWPRMPFSNSTLTKKLFLSKFNNNLRQSSSSLSTCVAIKSGICHVFNYETFTNPKRKKRNGTDKDVTAIKYYFKDLLKFNYFEHINESKSETLHNLRTIKTTDYTKIDCFVLIFLSHGDHEILYCSDREISRMDLIRNVCENPTLINVQKNIIIQACDGDLEDKGIYESDHNSNTIQIDPFTYLKYSDLVILACSVPGYISYRYRDLGSIFIQTLIKYLTKFGDTIDFMTIATLVSYEIGYENEFGDTSMKQMPFITSTQRQPFCFQKLNV